MAIGSPRSQAHRTNAEAELDDHYLIALAKQGRFTKDRHVGIQTCGMYWTFVAGLWPLLYGLVYLY